MTNYLSRRQLLQQSACGFGALAMQGLLANESKGVAEVAGKAGPLVPKRPHFAASAKRVIFLFMHGGVSHVDSF